MGGKTAGGRHVDFTNIASDAFRRANPELFGEIPMPAQVAASAGKSEGIGKTPTKKLNKTEERCKARLERYLGLSVLCQPTRLFPLAGGGTYTPDFLAYDPQRPELGICVVEVKGGYHGPGWEQGYDRWKRVAAQYDSPLFRFVMTTWSAKRQEWNDEWWGDGNDWPIHAIVPF